ncbi:MAG: response regulator [Chitinophagales bacterium]
MIIYRSPLLNHPKAIALEDISPFPFNMEIPLLPLYVNKQTNINLLQAKILLAGNVINPQLATLLFQSWNGQIDTANDGIETIEKVYFNQYDLILIDLQMPIMDGWELAKFIRTRLHLQTPLIALSSTIQSIDEEALTIAGFDNYLHKPIYPQSLCNLMCVLEMNKNNLNKSDIPKVTTSIDIAFIKKLSNNDSEFVQEIIRLFEEQTTEMIVQLPLLQSNREAFALNALVHKYKSSANSIGNKKLYKLCDQVEKETRREEPQWMQIAEHCDSIMPECKKILEEIPKILVILKAA